MSEFTYEDIKRINGSNAGEKEIVIPEGVESIKARFCDLNTPVEKVILPSTLKLINDHCFDGCKALKEITLPEGLTSIGCSCFRKSGIEMITIPESVTNMGSFCFTDCENLKKVEFRRKDVSGCKYDFYNCFWNCDSLEEVNLPFGIEYLKRTFLGCKKLTKVDIPSSVVGISERCFCGCEELESFEYPPNIDFSKCGTQERMLTGCKKIKNCTLRLNHIRPEFFNSWNCVETIIIEGSNITVDESAFTDCTSLRRIEFRGNVEKLNPKDGLFKGCDNLVEIVLSPENTQYYMKNGCLCDKKTKRLLRVMANAKKVDIPEEIRIIGESAFPASLLEAEINVPEKLKTLSEFCFDKHGLFYSLNDATKNIRLLHEVKKRLENKDAVVSKIKAVSVDSMIEMAMNECPYECQLKKYSYPTRTVAEIELPLCKTVFEMKAKPTKKDAEALTEFVTKLKSFDNMNDLYDYILSDYPDKFSSSNSEGNEYNEELRKYYIHRLKKISRFPFRIENSASSTDKTAESFQFDVITLKLKADFYLFMRGTFSIRNLENLEEMFALIKEIDVSESNDQIREKVHSITNEHYTRYIFTTLETQI